MYLSGTCTCSINKSPHSVIRWLLNQTQNIIIMLYMTKINSIDG